MENKKKYRKKWVNSNKEKVKFLYKNYYKIYSSLSKNKLKIIARNIIKRDKIKRPNLYPLECCICGVTDNIEFHHPLYEFPYSVYPLCRNHHRELHKNLEV